MVVNLGKSVGELVHEAHEDGLEPLKERLEPDDIGQILSYCAKQHCVAAGVACPGCARHTAARGLDDLDQFVAAHERIDLTESANQLRGSGEGTARFRNLDDLARNWAGEAYWFWARRVLRKLRYGIRKADALAGAGEREAPSVLLMAPQIPDNIGMVARAMGNFGLHDLRVIEPRDGWPSEKARAVASGAAAIIDDAALHESLGHAIGDLNWVCATTARQRDMRKPVLTPAQAAAEMRRRTAAGERCGMLFGRERNGLESHEIADADAIVMIPVSPDFASLNLAQAVLLLGYEWLKTGTDASLGRVAPHEAPVGTGFHLGSDKPARKQDLLNFFEHLEGELERLGFFSEPSGRHVVVRNLRNMFQRMAATDQEVRTLRGIVATLAQGKGSRRKRAE